MQVISRQRGVSLIEVLVAVLIFSLGLIGMAGLMMLATRSNQSAYLRTQVAFLANGIADRMRANPIAVWDGSYNSKALPTSTTQDCTSSGCTPDQLAAHDLGEWSGQLKTFLATPAATINCDTSNAGYTPNTTQLAGSPPFGGMCTVTISWYERDAVAPAIANGNGENGNTNGGKLQTYTWNVQP
jgi:type IV pilus assembly protein PilV